ncbi:MAG: PrgI family protein [Lachnospiraceae bacterium]|uniref:PrgI family protein n=1 Tax=Porcincola intestinalis TaxID=2606632 RepID=A0A6L5X374_9FIRM|nr:PrgI family protein [Porcincola intestinalis]MCI6767103.1 PrgI family protein [Lachnospiraceae bacterium]MSS13823.1 PrgI family protein [Porcincola intestinalis]
MAYVSVPKDLTKVKNKVAFNLTKRQIICLGIAAVIGLPFYFLTRGVIGNSNAATGMVLLMLPAFLFAMYEKDGMPLEKVLMNIIAVRFLKPDIRRYETENIYEMKIVSKKIINKKKNPQAAVKKGGQKRVRK